MVRTTADVDMAAPPGIEFLLDRLQQRKELTEKRFGDLTFDPRAVPDHRESRLSACQILDRGLIIHTHVASMQVLEPCFRHIPLTPFPLLQMRGK
ncbi:hypothetical protein ACIA8J_21615 [Streptomyces asoensis]|uniref:hypothetical protein n=1 Tax=Streptomyces asoensis TaxID=249586 RepID=UPI0037BCD845